MRRIWYTFLTLPLLGAAWPEDSAAARKYPWERLGTAELELYSDAGQTAARKALNNLQQIRGFFLLASPLPSADASPARIILFRSAGEFAQYASSPSERAFFVAGPRRDYIVMPDAPDGFRCLIHEYMHLIVRHSGLRLPLWLNEGWAEVYSTLRPVSDGVAVGDLIEGRVQTLRNSPWLDIDTLTTTDPESPTYKGNGPVATFYAESWALAHMLFLAPDYTDNFSKFISALQRGRNFAESCEAAFGKTPAQVYADLRQYFDRKIMYGKVFQAPLGKKAALPEIAKVEPFDARLMLADLDLALGRHMQARNEFDRAIVWDRCRHCACGRVHRRSPDCEAGLQ